MDEDEIEYLHTTRITVRNGDGIITDILEMPEGTPYQAVGFLADMVGSRLRFNEPITMSIKITSEAQPLIRNE